MSELLGTAEQLDLEAIEARVQIVQGAEYDRSTWTGGMLDFMTRTEVPALLARVRELEETEASMTRFRNARDEGGWAYLKGVSFDDCPYLKPGSDGIISSDLIDAWSQGYATQRDYTELYDGNLALLARVRELEAENAALRRQLGELCPVGDLDTITSLRVEIEALKEQVAALGLEEGNDE